MRLVIDPVKCTGCQLCTIFCSVRHRGLVDPTRANIVVLAQHRLHRRVPFTCFQCQDAPCQAVCPTEAIVRDTKTGALVVDGDLCTACGLCTEECPYGNMFLFPDDSAATKCDLCGGAPECATVCPQGAITVDDGAQPGATADIDAALAAARRELDSDPIRRRAG